MAIVGLTCKDKSLLKCAGMMIMPLTLPFKRAFFASSVLASCLTILSCGVAFKEKMRFFERSLLSKSTTLIFNVFTISFE